MDDDVFRRVLCEGVVLVLIGVAVGLANSLLATQFVEAMLFKIRATDATTFVTVAAELLTVVLLATYVRRGARRARTRSEPCAPTERTTPADGVAMRAGIVPLLAGLLASQSTRADAQHLLARRYAVGDSVAYHMVATNAGHRDTVQYTADAVGRVVRDSAGHVIEHVEWTTLTRNGKSVLLPAGSTTTQQVLSLAPGWQATPDVRGTDPRLIGPVLDLLTFYVDLQLAGRIQSLARAGDHVYVPVSVHPSWADGTRIIRGEDAIDFDLTLSEVDTTARVATLVARHVPPQKQVVPLSVDWMRPPVVDGFNNWLQIEKLPDGRYRAGVGKETFEDRIRVSLTDGRILKATMENPVDVLERDCADAALTECGAPTRYRILRSISVEARY